MIFDMEHVQFRSSNYDIGKEATMDVTVLATKALNHWAKYLPQKTADLKAAGTLEFRANQAAERALEEIAGLVKRGVDRLMAEEMVLPEYIILPPERGVE